MSIPTSASEFFEQWVPARLGEVLATGVQVNTRCRVSVSVGTESWVLAANNGRIEVTSGPEADPSKLSFCVALSPTLFQRFVLSELVNVPEVPASVPQNSPLLKLFNLDDESLSLIQNIPGALHLVIADGEDDSYRVQLGPSLQSLGSAACTLKCSLVDALALRAGTVAPMELFFGGRLQLEGDPQVAMGLAGLFL
jgi:hypothetical protein